MLILILNLLSIVFYIFVFWLASGIIRNKGNPPPIPCSKKHVEVVMAWISKYGLQDMSFVELGAGWGGRWYSLTKKYPNLQYTGIELLWPLWCFCKIIRPKGKFIWNDIRKCELEQYDIWCSYIGVDLNNWLTTYPTYKKHYWISVIFEVKESDRIKLIESYTHWTGNVYLYEICSRKDKI